MWAGVRKSGSALSSAQYADSPGVVRQRDGIERSHAGGFEIAAELGASFFARGINFSAVLPNVYHLSGEHRPAQDVVERGDVRSVGVDLRDTCEGAELVLSTLYESHSGTLVGDDCLWRIDDGLQNTL